MRRGLGLAGAILLLAATCMAASEPPEIDVSLDRARARLGETVILTVTVEGGGVDGRPTVLGGDGYETSFRGRRQSFSLINGRTSSSTSFSFGITPTRTGRLSLGPVRVTVDGKTYERAPLVLTVERAAIPTPGGRTRSPGNSAPDAEEGSSGEDLFITTSVDRDTAFVHDQITLSFRLYQAPGVSFGEQPSYAPPSTVGFLREELGDPKQFQTSRSGRTYTVTEIKTALFPTHPGKLTIGPAEVECLVEDWGRIARNPFSVFRRGFDYRRRILRSDPVDVQVLPLPDQGRPADFSGAVGRFTLSVAADTLTVRTNEAVTLRARVSGAGSVTTLGTLSLPPLDGVRVFHSGEEARTLVRGDRIVAEKLFTWVLVPAQAERLVIPRLRIPYFDPLAGRYAVALSEPLELQVLTGEAARLVTFGGRGHSVAAEDLRYLQTGSEGFRWQGDPSPWGPLPWVHAFPAATLLGAFVLRERRRRLRLDPAAARRETAYRDARARLRRLRGEDAGAAQRAAEILEDYLADRLRRERRGTPRTRLLAEAEALGASGELVQGVREFLESCDAVSFGPKTEPPLGGDHALRRARELLDALQEALGRGGS